MTKFPTPASIIEITVRKISPLFGNYEIKKEAVSGKKEAIFRALFPAAFKQEDKGG